MFRVTGLELRVSAPGKVILYGEHAVVYNKLALAASLGLRTKAKLVETSGNNFELICPALDMKFSFDLNV